MISLAFTTLFLAPLLGFFINGTFGRGRFAASFAGTLATLASAVSFAAGLYLAIAANAAPERTVSLELFSWFQVFDLKIPIRFIVDPVNTILVLLITGVGSLIHLFSIGYMHEDEGVVKYFSYLNLFLFNMLILVTGDSLPLLFVGWEGVGLCSYLLIGFWYQDVEKANAGMKAFIVNRVGDAAFILGMFFLFTQYGTLNLRELNALAPKDPLWAWFDPTVLGTLLLFVGATGKSAQIPLYVWLPDAMAGPTPVSALIHAATMVTAGVYMVARLSYLYLATPGVMMVIAIVGGLTAVTAALMGFAQKDIKKVLAYSTVSQLGYMFLACGVGAFAAGMFHLMTHAFFKALMFLGSGSVIHGMHHEQDMTKMGGLRRYMPVTYWTFFIGWLAIMGIPPFSGFFSKDEILWMAFGSERGHPLLWLLGWVGAMMTAFYMTRLMVLTFWGRERFDPHHHEPHESPGTMLIPLIALAFLAAFGGFLGIPHVIGEILPGHPQNWLEHWFEGVLASVPHQYSGQASMEWALMVLSVVGAILASVLAIYSLLIKPQLAQGFTHAFPNLYRWVEGKLFVDEFYEATIVQPLRRWSEELWAYFDVRLIDRLVMGSGELVRGFGRWWVLLQTGSMQFYAFLVVLSLVGFALVVGLS